MPEKLNKKPTRSEEAFAVFTTLPAEERNYAAVAEKVGASTATVKRWASKGRWRNRVAEREARVARRALDLLEAGEVTSRSRFLKIIELAVVKLARAIANGEIKGTFGDLDRLMRLKLFLESPEVPDGVPQKIVVNLIRGEPAAPPGEIGPREGDETEKEEQDK